MSNPTTHRPLANDPNWSAAYQKTRRSLIERLDNWEDQKTWDEFHKTYWRLIYSVATRAGLRPEEALDVVQETILGIAKQSKHKKFNPDAGSFKSWLMNITRWRIADQFRKRAKDTAAPYAVDDDRPTAILDRLPNPNPNPLDNLWKEEWQRSLAETALAKVKGRVSPKQFQIFHCYVIKGWTVKRVMTDLGVSMAQVYLAKHRVSNLIKKEVEELQRHLI